MDDTTREKLDQNTDNKITIVNINENPCDDFKTNLAVCMKNSDNNIMVCQSLRNFYENCLEEENKKSK
tara:strand:+ start:157 stop:360 length:204 start_codon:yes stop_codon:yes gene_type:complete